jgi:hypothetical protein
MYTMLFANVITYMHAYIHTYLWQFNPNAVRFKVNGAVLQPTTTPKAKHTYPYTYIHTYFWQFNPNAVRFKVNGAVLQPTTTPKTIHEDEGMDEDEDEVSIEAHSM